MATFIDPEAVLSQPIPANPVPADFDHLSKSLAFRGLGWSSSHRHRIVVKLAKHAVVAGPSILASVSEFPRGDVLDAAVDALDPLSGTLEGVVLLEEWIVSASSEHIHAREVCARVLGRVEKPELVQRATVFLTKMLNDPTDADLRYAAVWPLVQLDAKSVLENAAKTETDPLVQKELQDAINTLS